MKRKYLLTSLIALLVVAIVATSLASADNETFDDADNPEAAPVPQSPGYYLVGGSRNLDPLDFHQAGDMQFFQWADLNPGPGSFAFGQIDYFRDTHYLAPAPG
ncbi:MAG: hypothetical protein ACK2U9_18165, partial [Anaerolineae bacterium]